MVVTNGRGSGTWKKTIKPKGVGIEIKPFVSFGTSEKEQLKEEAERFAEFLALPLQFAVKM